MSYQRFIGQLLSQQIQYNLTDRLQLDHRHTSHKDIRLENKKKEIEDFVI